jgi:excisionase family DNA binding protein
MDESDSRTPSPTATLSVPEAGRLLGLGRNAAYDAARRGELPVLEFGRKKRVPCVALQRMLSEARPRSSEKLEKA